MNRQVTLVAVIVLIALSLLPADDERAVAADLEALQNPIDTSSALPRTDGTHVVWQESGDIYAANVTDLQSFLVAGGAPVQGTPDVDHQLVVWAEDTGASIDIRGKNLASGADFTVADSAVDDVLPAISGEWVVWVRQEGNVHHLMARNIMAMDEPVVLREAGAGRFPAIYRMETRPEIDGGNVLWAEVVYASDPGSPQGWYLDIVPVSGGEPRFIDGGEYNFDPLVPSYDIGGQTIVYTKASGSATNIQTFDLATGKSRTFLESMTSPGPGYPTTDGRYVFFPDHARDSSNTYDLLSWDLVTDSRFVAIADVSSEVMPNAGGGTVVFQDAAVPRNVWAAEINALLPSGPSQPPDVSDPDWTYFPETGHYLGFGFRDFWEGSGGLPVFGYPLTDPFTERNPDTGQNYIVQYFERQRYEWHPENEGTPYVVLLGRLGAQILALQHQDWQTLPKADPSAPHYFAETGHAIAPEFYAYWSSHGLEFGDDGVTFRESLALFGYPISEPMLETNADGHTVMTQWFERAVFEYHPTNPPEWQVLLRRVGAEMLVQRDWPGIGIMPS